MTLADPSFPSSETFDVLSKQLSTSPPQSLARLVKSANTIFAFTLTASPPPPPSSPSSPSPPSPSPPSPPSPPPNTTANDTTPEPITASWYIDLKRTGSVGRGLSPEQGQKPDVEMAMAEGDFAKMVAGEVTAQKLFMAGKIKIKGDVMRAGKVEGVFKGVIGKVEGVKAKL